MLGLQAVQFLGAFVEETVELPQLQLRRFRSCSTFSWSMSLLCRFILASSSGPDVDVPVVVQRQGFSQWRCHRSSSSPVYVDIQLCNTDGYEFPAILLMAAMMGFLTHFA